MKNKIYQDVGTFPKTNKKIEMDTPNKQMHDCSLSWLGTDTSIKRVTGLNYIDEYCCRTTWHKNKSWSVIYYISKNSSGRFHLVTWLVVKNAWYPITFDSILRLSEEIRKDWRYQHSKDKQYNSRKMTKIQNRQQNTTQKTKEWATRTPIKTGVNPCAPEGLAVTFPLVTTHFKNNTNRRNYRGIIIWIL